MVHRVIFAFVPHILLSPWTIPYQPTQSPATSLEETVVPLAMDYQPGPSPGWTRSFTPPPPNPEPATEVVPYDHSRYGMVILTVLSLAEVVVPHLGAYRPLAAGMLYLSRSLPFLYWALVSRYPDGWTPSSSPWLSTTPGHDSFFSVSHFHFILVVSGAVLVAYCILLFQKFIGLKFHCTFLLAVLMLVWGLYPHKFISTPR